MKTRQNYLAQMHGWKRFQCRESWQSNTMRTDTLISQMHGFIAWLFNALFLRRIMTHLKRRSWAFWRSIFICILLACCYMLHTFAYCRRDHTLPKQCSGIESQFTIPWPKSIMLHYTLPTMFKRSFNKKNKPIRTGICYLHWPCCDMLCKTFNFTPPEFNSSPLKDDGWKITFLLGWLIFRGYVKLPGSIVISALCTTPGIVSDIHRQCHYLGCNIQRWMVAAELLFGNTVGRFHDSELGCFQVRGDAVKMERRFPEYQN